MAAVPDTLECHRNAMKSAFAPFDERLGIINEVIKPGYARLRAREAQVHAGALAPAG